MKPLMGLVAVALALAVAALLAEAGAFGGAWVFHQRGLYDDEIRWLESFQPVMRWERGVERLIARRERERIERVLAADRIDVAVHLFRASRARARASSRPLEPGLLMLGMETYQRAADRLVKHGRLSEAADWGDSVFVLAIRAPSEPHRYAALAAFLEGLELRVRDGRPCEALARVQWAEKGLGGVIPGLAGGVKADLTRQCAQQRRWQAAWRR